MLILKISKKQEIQIGSGLKVKLRKFHNDVITFVLTRSYEDKIFVKRFHLPVGEEFIIDECITLVFLKILYKDVRVGIKAPPNVLISKSTGQLLNNQGAIE